MAITTYAELQTAIAGALDRSDLTADIKNFIALAEGDMNSEVVHWQMEKRSDASFDAQFEDLPTDWIEVVRIVVGGKPIDLISHAKMIEYRANTDDTTGQPRYYSLSAGQVELFPTPGSAYTATIIYKAQIPALSDSNTSNWLLTLSPAAYYYGALIHSAPFLVEDERVPIWAGLYQKAIDRVNSAGRRGQFSGSGLSMR